MIFHDSFFYLAIYIFPKKDSISHPYFQFVEPDRIAGGLLTGNRRYRDQFVHTFGNRHNRSFRPEPAAAGNGGEHPEENDIARSDFTQLEKTAEAGQTESEVR